MAPYNIFSKPESNAYFMTITSANNKRIAKNTLFLYFRMFAIMLVGLYTSRVVLQVLGFEDFGTYNIVGGVVVLFSFINSAMTIGTQRHLSYELGKGEAGDIAKIYSASLNIHLYTALVFFILAETLGLWFVNTQLNLPVERTEAANWVYQFSVLNCLAGVVRVPDNALIVAYERMSFFAYMGVLEAVLKLLIVYVLLVFDYDKLIFYSVLLALTSLSVNVAYRAYCSRVFHHVKWMKIRDRGKYKEILSFTGWTMFGSIACVGLQQGVNIIANVFYGVTLNAAVGIANQINGHITTFFNGFQQALNPQLTMSQARGDKQRQYALICTSAKYSCFIMLLIAFPVIINLDYILTFWLGKYPPHTASICTLIIVDAVLASMVGPLWVTIFATGRIKTYQMVTSLLLLLNIPCSYISSLIGMEPEMMFIIRIVINIVCLGVRLWFLRNLISLKITEFIRKVLFPVALVLFSVASPFAFLPKGVLIAQNFTALLFLSSSICLYTVIVICLVGLTRNERNYIREIIKQRIQK